eukprot:m.297816 g.297816  ORF g.297816 m.297816 type:complete len:710 (-) comp20087_c0_seq8:961-3090(-)
MSNQPEVFDTDEQSSRPGPIAMAATVDPQGSGGAESPNENKNSSASSYQSHSAPVSPRRANRADKNSDNRLDGAGSAGIPVDAALKKQLSYYFSEVNLAKDSYLLSQMTPEYYVACSLIANFPAVRKITQDHDRVVATLRRCENVQVTPDGVMVRPLFVPFAPIVPTQGPPGQGAGPAVVPSVRSSAPGYGPGGGAGYVIINEGIPDDANAEDVMALFRPHTQPEQGADASTAPDGSDSASGGEPDTDGGTTSTVVCAAPQWAKRTGVQVWKLKFASEAQAQDAQRKLCSAQFKGAAIKAHLMQRSPSEPAHGAAVDPRFLQPPPYYGGMPFPSPYGVYLPNGVPVSGAPMYAYAPYMFNMYDAPGGRGHQQQHRQHHPHHHPQRGAPSRQQQQHQGGGGTGSHRRHKNSTGGGSDAAPPPQSHHAHARGQHRRTSSDGSDLSTGSGGRRGRQQRPGTEHGGGGGGGKAKKGSKNSEGGGGGGKKSKKKQSPSAPIFAPENFPALPGDISAAQKSDGVSAKGGSSMTKSWSVPLVDVVKGLTVTTSSAGEVSAATNDTKPSDTATTSGKTATADATVTPVAATAQQTICQPPATDAAKDAAATAASTRSGRVPGPAVGGSHATTARETPHDTKQRQSAAPMHDERASATGSMPATRNGTNHADLATQPPGNADASVGKGGGAAWGQPSGGRGGTLSFADMLKRDRAQEP